MRFQIKNKLKSEIRYDKKVYKPNIIGQDCLTLIINSK